MKFWDLPPGVGADVDAPVEALPVVEDLERDRYELATES